MRQSQNNRRIYWLPLLCVIWTVPASAQAWTTVWTPDSAPAAKTAAKEDTHESDPDKCYPCKEWEEYPDGGGGRWVDLNDVAPAECPTPTSHARRQTSEADPLPDHLNPCKTCTEGKVVSKPDERRGQFHILIFSKHNELPCPLFFPLCLPPSYSYAVTPVTPDSYRLAHPSLHLARRAHCRIPAHPHRPPQRPDSHLRNCWNHAHSGDKPCDNPRIIVGYICSPCSSSPARAHP